MTTKRLNRSLWIKTLTKTQGPSWKLFLSSFNSGSKLFPTEFQLFLSLVSLLTYSPGSALHMRFIYSLQIWWYLWASKSTSSSKSKSIVCYIPGMCVLMLNSQCTLHDNQIFFPIPYLPPLKTCFFDPFFSGKYEKLFSSLYSLYSLITWKRQKATFCAHCVYSLAMFSSKERLERKLPN